jgi:predicted dehydrogenase
VAELAHLPAFASRPEFELVAVAEPLPARRHRAQDLLPGIRVYEDLATLLSRESALDFVDICTPPRSHTPLAVVALKRVCHVLCEKPLFLSAPEVQEIKEILTQVPPAVLVTANNWKYAPLLAKTTEMIRAGAIGRVQQLDWRVYRTDPGGGGLSPWRQDAATSMGGILVDHGWHAFYLLILWGGRPRAIKARLVRGPGSPVEIEAEVEMKFSEATGRLFLTWQASTRSNRGRLRGEAGEIILEDDILMRVIGDAVIESHRFPEKLSGRSHHPQWMAGVLEEFLQEINFPEKRGGNFQEAETCAHLIRLAYQSHESGGIWLHLAPQ